MIINRIGIICLLIAQLLTSKERTSKETLKNSYKFKGESKQNTLIIKNFWGEISITGQNSNTIDVTIHKTIWARSLEQFEKAEKEVTLDVSEEEDLLELYVDGPFREKHGHNFWHEGQYKVTYDFHVKVPFNTQLDLETVNDGDITVHHIKGKCSINNINGGIEAKGICEAGKIYALNSDVNIHFSKTPTQDCVIGSLNGDVKLYFNANPSIDFIIETFNGETYSDFKVKRIDSEPYINLEKKGKYKTGHHDKIRIGKGGAVIHWKGFNGDLMIINKDK